VELACTSWSFPTCNLREVVGIVRALGIGALDLGSLQEPALNRDTRIRSPRMSAARLAMKGSAVVLADANNESAELRA